MRSGALLGEVVEGQNAIKKVECGPKARDLVVEPSTFIWSTNQKFQETVLRISAGDVSIVRRPKRSLRLVIGSNTCALPKIAIRHNCIKVLLVDKLCCNTGTRDQKACGKKPSHIQALS